MKRKRVTLDRGICKDAYGIAVIVNVGKLRREERFPPDTELKKLKERRDEIRVALRKIAPRAERGTFAEDAARYLKAVAAMPTFKERQKHIELWVSEFGFGPGTLSIPWTSTLC
jgi:hypothetical protein